MKTYDGNKITDWISMKIEEKTHNHLMPHINRLALFTLYMFPAAFDLMTSFAIETDQFQSNLNFMDVDIPIYHNWTTGNGSFEKENTILLTPKSPFILRLLIVILKVDMN
ncbi:hypothetical protein T09_4513 [Trichinella sp. T9]|nr:hypothetical protein T09_4513 [Trichinella sp. T9]